MPRVWTVPAGRGVIGPKVPAPTPAEERRAYDIATERDDFTCQRCLGWCGAPQRDHRKNRSQGGLTLASNLQLLGLTCHSWKGENPSKALEDGWAVPAWGDPAAWPARRWVRQENGTVRAAWVLYDDDGGWAEISATEARRRMEGGE